MKIVQLGANKGSDPLYRYIRRHNVNIDLLLLVEPFKLHLEDLAECYRDYENVFIENVAVYPSGSDQKELKIWYYEKDGPGYEVASCDPHHIYKHYGIVTLDSFIIPCMTIESLLSKYKLVEFDWLLVDVEGLDAELILNFDWNSYAIKRVDIEHLHLNTDTQKVLDLFASLGYSRIESTNSFDWAFELPGNIIKTTIE